MDYSELVKALRCCATMTCKGDECKYMILGCHDCFPKLHDDAADAIEALQKTLKAVQTNSGINFRMWEEAKAEVERLQAQLPKRGKWIVDGMYTYNLRELNGKAYEPVYRCSCCNRQMESYLRLDEPKMPEDADFPEYCPHCGAKMEVQDG